MLGCDKIRISMLFIDQLKTGADAHLEQAPINDNKKRRNMAGIATVIETKEILL